MYLTYTICSNYHSTTEVAYCVPYLHRMPTLSIYSEVSYCVPYLHNMLLLSLYYQGSILCTLPTQYAPNITILFRMHIVCLTFTICSKYHNTTKVAYCVPYLHRMPTLSIYSEVSYFVPYLHNMLPLSNYNQGGIMCTYLHNMRPLS